MPGQINRARRSTPVQDRNSRQMPVIHREVRSRANVATIHLSRSRESNPTLHGKTSPRSRSGNPGMIAAGCARTFSRAVRARLTLPWLKPRRTLAGMLERRRARIAARCARRRKAPSESARGNEQHDPCHATTRLRCARPRVPPAYAPDRHAPGGLIKRSCRFRRLDFPEQLC